MAKITIDDLKSPPFPPKEIEIESLGFVPFIRRIFAKLGLYRKKEELQKDNPDSIVRYDFERRN